MPAFPLLRLKGMVFYNNGFYGSSLTGKMYLNRPILRFRPERNGHLVSGTNGWNNVLAAPHQILGRSHIRACALPP